MVCTFFGHRDLPIDITDVLDNALTDLIENAGVVEFLVGNQGAFDCTVAAVLRDLKKRYPHIRCAIVYAYIPTLQTDERCLETIYPEVVATAPPRFAIDRRNRWMLEKADVVVVYVKSPAGGAVKFKGLAERKKKMVINLAEKL